MIRGCPGLRWASARTISLDGTTPSAKFVRFVTERCMTSGHDADPVINPSADRAEVLGLGRVVPACLLDARLGRRQLQPQRGNLGCRVRSAISVREAAL